MTDWRAIADLLAARLAEHMQLRGIGGEPDRAALNVYRAACEIAGERQD